MPTIELAPSDDTSLRESGGFDGIWHGMDYAIVGAPNAANSRSRALIRFDASSIPAEAVVTAVTLRLTWFVAPSGHRVGVYRVLPVNTWAVPAALWTYRSTGVRWAGDAGSNGGPDAGCSIAGTDYDATRFIPQITSVVLGTQNYAAGADGIADVQSWVDGTAANNGLYIVSEATDYGGEGRFRTVEYATAAERPRLIVEYEEVSASIIPAAMHYRRMMAGR